MTLRPGRLWAVAFGAYFLMIGAWAVAMPYDAVADEHDHIYRAVGVVSGEVMPEPTKAVRGSGAFQTVPKGLVRPWPPIAGGSPQNASALECWVNKVGESVACAQAPDGDRTPVRMGSGAGRYHPVYYAMVGLPLKLWPGWAGVLLARLIAGAMAAALLAGALVAIVRYSRHRLMMAGLLVSTTPMTMHFMSGINPNGLEMAAGIAFFCAVIVLLLGRLEERPRWLLALAGVSGLWLAMLRPTGLLTLAAAFVAFVVPWRDTNVRVLLRMRAARWWAAAIVFAGVTAVGWLVVMKGTDMGTDFRFGRTYTLGAAVLAVADDWGDWLSQMIGLFSWYDVRLPAPVVMLWEFAAAALLVFAVVMGRWVDRWRLAVLLVGAVILPSAIQAYSASSIGFVTQGRYMLPTLVGVALLSAFIVEERGFEARHARSLVRLFVVLLLPMQLFALVLMMVRWQRGLPNHYGLGWLNPLVGDWHPVLGSSTPLISLTLGLAVLGWLAWRAATARADHSTEPASPAEDADERPPALVGQP